MVIYLALDKENCIRGIGSSYFEVSDCNTQEVEIDTLEPSIMSSFSSYKYIEGNFVKNEEEQLKAIKTMKISQLQQECQKTIEAGFNYNYEGVDYWFSLDAEAQSNFISTYQIMRDGIISEVPWTVKVNNEYARLVVNVEMMKDLTLLILQHKTNNISKFRDILSPLVEGATSLEEVNSIKW